MALHDSDTGRGTSLELVLAELKQGKTVPCYLLYGDEEFRVQEALDKITATMIPDAQDRELNLFIIDGESEDILAPLPYPLKLSALSPVWRQMNGFLVRWLMRKYKSLAWHKRRARRSLGCLAEKWPETFVHWKEGYAPMAG